MYRRQLDLCFVLCVEIVDVLEFFSILFFQKKNTPLRANFIHFRAWFFRVAQKCTCRALVEFTHTSYLHIPYGFGTDFSHFQPNSWSLWFIENLAEIGSLCTEWTFLREQPSKLRICFWVCQNKKIIGSSPADLRMCAKKFCLLQ